MIRYLLSKALRVPAVPFLKDARNA
jgi:hypothetical protein